MEVNDFIDLNTTELFDDSNESFDKLEENDNSGRNISEDDNFGTTTSTDMADTREEFSSSDAGKTSTDVVSRNNFTFFPYLNWCTMRTYSHTRIPTHTKRHIVHFAELKSKINPPKRPGRCNLHTAMLPQFVRYHVISNDLVRRMNGC